MRECLQQSAAIMIGHPSGCVDRLETWANSQRTDRRNTWLCALGGGRGASPTCISGVNAVAGVVRIPTRGPTGKPFLTAACFDANAKANRLASAGRGRVYTVSDALGDTLFFGPVHQVLSKLDAGRLPLSATYPGSDGSGPDSSDGNAAGTDSNSNGGTDSAAAASDEELETEAQVEHNCHPNLSCARESSVSSSISDEHGIVGAVCAHGQGLLGLFMGMPAPERLLYYDLAASYLATLVDLGVMYLDTGCIFEAHWKRHMPGLPPLPSGYPGGMRAAMERTAT